MQNTNVPKQIHVQGYIRNKKRKEDKTESIIPTVFMAVAGLGLLAIVLWKVTLVAAGTGLTVHSVYRFAQARADLLANGLVVNNMGKRRVI